MSSFVGLASFLLSVLNNPILDLTKDNLLAFSQTIIFYSQ